jgi:hypothetical protein
LFLVAQKAAEIEEKLGERILALHSAVHEED